MPNNNLSDAALYINREFAALDFNQRVLSLACDERLPLFERLRFLFIVCSNLDEFFEIRVAGVKEKVALGSNQLSIDGLAPQQLLDGIVNKAHALTDDIYQTFNQQLLPGLGKQKIYFLDKLKPGSAITKWARSYFLHHILPVLSPIGLDPAHPFPRLVNKSLNFIVSLSGRDAFGRSIEYAIVHAPRALPRAIQLPDELSGNGQRFVYLTTLIQNYVHYLFPGMEISGCYPFRLTRNSDFFLHEEEIEDLAAALKTELFSRHYGHVVRLEITNRCPQPIVDFLLQKHHLTKDDVYYCDGPVNLHRYMAVIDSIKRDDLNYQSFTPKTPSHLLKANSIFDAIKEQDILLHHPYESFTTVIDFVKQAAHDPNVLAIKQTLYRTHSGSAMVSALCEAARSGKEVTAVIELRARFDEESNLKLANDLEQAGALVLYGVVGYKTHTKMTLVVRRDGNHLRRYVHLGTGNYHERTAKQYTDIGLITCNKDIGRDTQIIFHQLTGLGRTVKLKQLYHSPFTLQKKLLSLIEKTCEAAINKQPAEIFLKVNGLTDKSMIKALYRASQLGVKIHLVVRSLCCLRPNLKGISENIKVHSMVGRFLEHHRVYYFKYADQEKLYCASADMMERNLYSRIELMFPILAPECIKKVKDEIIKNYLKDNRDCWVMHADGSYRPKNQGAHSAQSYLLNK